MIFKRKIYADLLAWKTSSNRKPLLLRGARQVGKTTLVKEFAKEFTHFINLNLEKESHRKLFEHDNVNNILNAVFLQNGIVADDQPTLLFIDEIQESPLAIQSMRYFLKKGLTYMLLQLDPYSNLQCAILKVFLLVEFHICT